MEMGGGTVIIVGMILCFFFFNDTSPPERRRHQITQVETTVLHWRTIALSRRSRTTLGCESRGQPLVVAQSWGFSDHWHASIIVLVLVGGGIKSKHLVSHLSPSFPNGKAVRPNLNVLSEGELSKKYTGKFLTNYFHKVMFIRTL